MWNIVAGASPRCNYVIFLKINLSCSAWGEAKGAKNTGLASYLNRLVIGGYRYEYGSSGDPVKWPRFKKTVSNI